VDNAAFAGITSIVNGKVNALWACRLIIAVLLQNFYSNGTKTYEELIAYSRLPGDSQRAPDQEAMSRVLCQAYTVVAHVPARSPER